MIAQETWTDAAVRQNLSLGAPNKLPSAKLWKSLDKGLYGEAEGEQKYGIQKLAEMDPMPEDVQADCIARAFNKFGVADPESARGKAVAEWAKWNATLEVYLATGHIRTRGIGQSQVRDFFTDYTVTTLFPAYIESQIIAGQLATGIVNELVFDIEQVTSRKVDALYYSSADENLSIVAEGAELPILRLTTADSTIQLKKYGGILEVSYEALAEQRVDALGFWARRIGMNMSLDETDELLELLILGDGTTNGSAETDSTDRDAASGGTVAYNDMVNWQWDFADPYQMDIAVGMGSDLAAIAKLSEFKDAALALGMGALRLPTPLSVRYLRRDPCSTATAYESQLMIGIDSRFAAKKYTYGGFISEADRLIERQIQRRSFAYHCGFRKVDAAAVICYDINSKL